MKRLSDFPGNQQAPPTKRPKTADKKSVGDNEKKQESGFRSNFSVEYEGDLSRMTLFNCLSKDEGATSIVTTQPTDTSNENEADASLQRLIDAFVAISSEMVPISHDCLEPRPIRQKDETPRQERPRFEGKAPILSEAPPKISSSHSMSQNMERDLLEWTSQEMRHESLFEQLDQVLSETDDIIKGVNQEELIRAASRNNTRTASPCNQEMFSGQPGNDFHWSQPTMMVPVGSLFNHNLGHGGLLHANQTHAGVPPFRGGSCTTASLLCLPTDEKSISSYQKLVREQIQVFAADEQDVDAIVHGRNSKINYGQVGFRCRHCAHLPPEERQPGGTSFPTRLSVVYQSGQNIAKGHLEKHCLHIPPEIRNELIRQREVRSARGGGKKYWADGVRAMGVEELDGMLYFSSML